MPMTSYPDTILAHPALAGRTILTRREHGWAAFEILSGGQLGEGRPIASDPTVHAWRDGVPK